MEGAERDRMGARRTADSSENKEDGDGGYCLFVCLCDHLLSRYSVYLLDRPSRCFLHRDSKATSSTRAQRPARARRHCPARTQWPARRRPRAPGHQRPPSPPQIWSAIAWLSPKDVGDFPPLGAGRTTTAPSPVASFSRKRTCTRGATTMRPPAHRTAWPRLGRCVAQRRQAQRTGQKD